MFTGFPSAEKISFFLFFLKSFKTCFQLFSNSVSNVFVILRPMFMTISKYNQHLWSLVFFFFLERFPILYTFSVLPESNLSLHLWFLVINCSGLGNQNNYILYVKYGLRAKCCSLIPEYGQHETNNSYLEIKPNIKYETKVIISYTNSYFHGTTANGDNLAMTRTLGKGRPF